MGSRSTQLQKELTHTILLHPSYFGPRMLNYLESKLYLDVEGTCSGQFGYIIAVVSILDIGKGMVLPASGQAEFVTRYRAIVFKPFKGEVVDGVVNNVSKVCLFIRVVILLVRLDGKSNHTDGLLRGCGPPKCICLASGTYTFQCMSSTRVQRRLTRRKAHPSRHAVRPKFQSSLFCI